MSEPLVDAAHGFFYGGSHTETMLGARSSVRTVHELPVRLQCKAVHSSTKNCSSTQQGETRVIFFW